MLYYIDVTEVSVTEYEWLRRKWQEKF